MELIWRQRSASHDTPPRKDGRGLYLAQIVLRHRHFLV
jgi:hypothetical protein